jgi:hypothetical protein
VVLGDLRALVVEVVLELLGETFMLLAEVGVAVALASADPVVAGVTEVVAVVQDLPVHQGVGVVQEEPAAEVVQEKADLAAAVAREWLLLGIQALKRPLVAI